MKKIMLTIAIMMAFGGCTTNMSAQSSGQNGRVDLTQYIGHDEKEVVAMITGTAGAPEQYVKDEEAGLSCYGWKGLNNKIGIYSVWFKKQKLYSFVANSSCKVWDNRIKPN